MRLKVSLIIPNYNFYNYINQTFEKFLGQTFNDNKIIVIDYNST